MIRSLVTLLIAAAPASASTLDAASFGARAFEASAASAVASFSAEDAFAGVGACGVLDVKTIRPFSLEEAEDLLQPCVSAAAAKYGAKAVAASGFISAPQSGRPGRAGILLKTDLAAGSQGHRDLAAAIARREGRLLGHEVRVLTKGQPAPAAVSALQQAVSDCMVVSVVRDIRSGEDFAKLYGRCLTRDPELKIVEVRPSEGLSVTLKTEAEGPRVESYNGFVTVNAGKGPVAIMIIAYGAQVALP